MVVIVIVVVLSRIGGSGRNCCGNKQNFCVGNVVAVVLQVLLLLLSGIN